MCGCLLAVVTCRLKLRMCARFRRRAGHGAAGHRCRLVLFGIPVRPRQLQQAKNARPVVKDQLQLTPAPLLHHGPRFALLL